MPSGKKTGKKAKTAKKSAKKPAARTNKAAKGKPAKSKAKAKPAKAKKPPKAAKKLAKKPAKAKKPAPKKAPPKKPAAKKAPPKKPVAKKPAPKKAVSKAPPAPKAAKAPPAPKPAKVAAPAKAAKSAAPAKAAPAKTAPAPAPEPATTTAAAAKAKKRKPIATTSLAATPIIRPIGSEAPAPAPPPPPAKPGHVDHQVLSAISYGLFAAVNKTFGFAGQSVVKNASLRMLEYGYKRGWLPPKSRDPVRALNEFFGRLEMMGYADKIHVGKRGDAHVLEVQGLADFDAVWSLKEMHYPLLPVFLGEMLQAIVDQYFGMKATTEPLQMEEQKRGFTLTFHLHERPSTTDVSRLVAYSRVDEFED